MITGHFDNIGDPILSAPIVTAIVKVDNTGTMEYVNFLANTRFSRSCLSRQDLTRLQVDPADLDLTRRYPVNDSGGPRAYVPHHVLLYLSDNHNGVLWYAQIDLQDIWTGPNDRDPQGQEPAPSILGRDFLNMCQVVMDRPRDTFTMEPVDMTSFYLVGGDESHEAD